MTRLGALAVCAGAPALLLLLAVAAAQDDMGSIITESMFESMLPNRGKEDCVRGFYTYDAFIAAAKSFPAFGTSGASAELTRRELAAFFGQTSHETTGGTPGRSDQFEWGYCYNEETSKTTSAPYYGRGPIQLTGESNYELAGKALNRPELVDNPELVSTDPVVSFQTAIWFWMTPQGNKPSCHDVILGNWAPGEADRAAGRVPGYGVITNIINGRIECGMGQNRENVDRIGYYTRYCSMLGTTPGDSLDCYNQRNFAG